MRKGPRPRVRAFPCLAALPVRLCEKEGNDVITGRISSPDQAEALPLGTGELHRVREDEDGPGGGARSGTVSTRTSQFVPSRLRFLPS